MGQEFFVLYEWGRENWPVGQWVSLFTKPNPLAKTPRSVGRWSTPYNWRVGCNGTHHEMSCCFQKRLTYKLFPGPRLSNTRSNSSNRVSVHNNKILYKNSLIKSANKKIIPFYYRYTQKRMATSKVTCIAALLVGNCIILHFPDDPVTTVSYLLEIFVQMAAFTIVVDLEFWAR